MKMRTMKSRIFPYTILFMPLIHKLNSKSLCALKRSFECFCHCCVSFIDLDALASPFNSFLGQ